VNMYLRSARTECVVQATRKRPSCQEKKFPKNSRNIRGRGHAGSVDFETEGAIVTAGGEGVLAVFERLVSFDLIEMTA
jgi:hypothetical protein